MIHCRKTRDMTYWNFSSFSPSPYFPLVLKNTEDILTLSLPVPVSSANSLEPGQARQNVWPDLCSNCFTWWTYRFGKNNLKTKKHEKITQVAELNLNFDRINYSVVPIIRNYKLTRAVTQVLISWFWWNFEDINCPWFLSFLPRMQQIWPIWDNSSGRKDRPTQWQNYISKLDDKKANFFSN